MYQHEMFSNGSLKGARYIANGCYGQVYEHPDYPNDWVIKYADKDGTLNYLEWCKAMQDAGKGMRGMPNVDVLVHLENDRYMVIMSRYDNAEHLFSLRDVSAKCSTDYEYITELIAAFENYCSDNLSGVSGWGMVNDLHSGNVMWCNKTSSVIVTDPCANDYLLPAGGYFILH